MINDKLQRLKPAFLSQREYMEINRGNIVVRLAEKKDIDGVKKLLDRYHAKNITGDERKNGFVTTDMTVDELNELAIQERGITIAIDQNNEKIVGLLLGASWAFLNPWPMFDYMASILGDFTYQGKALDTTTSYQYGPICIAEEYRNQGIGEWLLAHQKAMFYPRYPVIVTFVNVLNPRSYAFHTRNKFEEVGCFHFNGNRYHLLALSDTHGNSQA